MFFRKKKDSNKNEASSNGEQAPKTRKRHFFRKFFKYFSLFILLLFISLGGALYWVCQIQSGQQWLMTTANKLLAPKPGADGLNFRINSLSGSLPFNFTIGIESKDAKGFWLSAPENTFTLKWKELPACLHISALRLVNVDISRFPELPPSEKNTEETRPFGIKDFQELLHSTSNFLAEKHWWLPEIILDGIELKNALLPQDLLPSSKAGKDGEQRLTANLNLNASFIDNAAKAGIKASLKDQQDKVIEIPSFSFRAINLDTNLDFKPNKNILNSLLNLELKIEDNKLDIQDLPSDLLGENLLLNLNLSATANTANQDPSVKVLIEGPNLNAGHIILNNKLDWESGPEWKNGAIDGNGNYFLKADIFPLLDNWIEAHPTSPLAMLRKAITLKLNADADLPKANILLNLAAPEIIASGHNLSNLDLQLSTKALDLPLPPYGLDLLKKEHHCDLKLSANIDKETINFSTQAYFQALATQLSGKSENSKINDNTISDKLSWLASLRNLNLSALGLKGKGNIQAFIPPEKMPALDGGLDLELSQWQALQKFIPDQSLSGNVHMELHLDNALARDPSRLAFNSASTQNALLNLSIPTFVMRPKTNGQSVNINKLQGRIDLTDIFNSLKVDLALQAARIQAAGMGINADIKAQGPISGPLTAEIKTKGDINSSLAASWSPGTAILKNCNISLTLPSSLSPSGKPVPLAIRAENPAIIHYGEKGIGVEKLNIKLQPSGSLQIDGGISPDKLGFKINLDAVNFKPWQILLPQIPLGYASLKVNLAGSPKTPNGNFDLSLRDVSLPGNPLPPFGLTLKGAIENNSGGSALALHLNLDPKSLKALGCDKSEVVAKIPLSFANDGVPNVNMTAPLAAHILWNGAIGPIWNLLPMPDMRLNGRVAININAGGTVKTPKIRGGVSINKARFEDLLLGVLLTDINLQVDLSEHGLAKQVNGVLDSLPGAVKLSLNASDGRGGTIDVNGGAAIDGTDLDIKAKINRLRPLRRRDIHIDLSGDATIAGSALAPIINGQILVNQGEVLLNNLEIMSSVTTLPITQPKAAKAKTTKIQVEQKKEESKGTGNINFKIDMLPRFTVEGRGLTSIWTAHLLVSGNPFNPSITGNISSVRGNFDFLGKIFTLTKGIVFFGGGSLSNPLINMELTNETPDLTAHIIVSGPVNKIKLELTSDPQLPRDEILSRVLFGRSVGDLSRFEALQLAAGIAQLAGMGSGDSILSSAKKALGVDVLRLGTSPSGSGENAGDTTAGGTTIEMGKYINDMIYMGVQQGMKADSTAFIIEMELTPRTNLEIRTEQNNTWGGLKWKYNY